MTNQRKLILEYIAQNGTITKKQATEICKHFYYSNASKYVGEILSSLVKAGVLERVKRGTYQFKGKIKEPLDNNQIGLFS